MTRFFNLKAGFERRLIKPPRVSASRSGVTAFMISTNSTESVEIVDKETRLVSPSIITFRNFKSWRRPNASPTLESSSKSNSSARLVMTSDSLEFELSD